MAAVEESVERIVRQGRFEFVATYQPLARVPRRLLRVLAAGGPIRSMQTGEMVERLRVANPSAIRRAVHALQSHDLVELTPQGWEVSNPFLRIRLRDHVDDE